MARIYRYIYYRISSVNLGIWREVDLSQFNACCALALLSATNVFTLLVLVGAAGVAISKAVFLALFGVSLVGHHLYFVASGRHLGLAEEFSKSLSLTPRAGLVLVWIYAVGSLALFLAVLHANRVVGVG